MPFFTLFIPYLSRFEGKKKEETTQKRREERKSNMRKTSATRWRDSITCSNSWEKEKTESICSVIHSFQKSMIILLFSLLVPCFFSFSFFSFLLLLFTFKLISGKDQCTHTQSERGNEGEQTHKTRDKKTHPRNVERKESYRTLNRNQMSTMLIMVMMHMHHLQAWMVEWEKERRTRNVISFGRGEGNQMEGKRRDRQRSTRGSRRRWWWEKERWRWERILPFQKRGAYGIYIESNVAVE